MTGGRPNWTPCARRAAIPAFVSSECRSLLASIAYRSPSCDARRMRILTSRSRRVALRVRGILRRESPLVRPRATWARAVFPGTEPVPADIRRNATLYWPLARSRAVERRESMPIRSAANIPFAIKAMRAQPPRLPEPDAAARLPTAVALREGLGALVAPRTAAEGRPLLGAAVGSLSVNNALGSADLVVEVGPNEAGSGE
jgi:hypothetical protein